jgi:two-component system, OmpR family, response regulator
MSASILLVEDDPMIGQSLGRALKDIGMQVEWARNATQGLQAIGAGGFDLILLDLGLPDKSGLEVLEQMRQQGDRTPLFIVTARDGIDDRVTGLDHGADDYLVKPFSFKELMARILGVLRRNAKSVETVICNGEISMDLATRETTYRGKTLPMSAREFALLHALVEHTGMILSRSQIENRIYGEHDAVGSNAVEVLIHAVRKKFDNEIIRNVRGIGWMVVRHSS